jgi:hypothetical protein
MAHAPDLTTTRNSLHAVAELVLAGGQHLATGRISLRVVPVGFATRFEPDLRVEGTDLVGDFGRTPLDGATARSLCSAAGIPLADLSGVYADGATYGPDDLLGVDARAARVLEQAWAVGDGALRAVAPDTDPILWPEHFDVGISLGEVNLGVSPGDSFSADPYAYVGPWSVPAGNPFFDAPFGAARPLADLGGVDAVAAFFVEGLRQAEA